MLFDTLDIPESLLSAQEEGKLVVFAGAGVSMGVPSGLPSFVRLAETIAQRPLTDEEKSRLDHFLGELKSEGREVHALTVQALNQPNSRPTPLHEQLVRLFARPEHVRIVTTNFDPHFARVVGQAHPGVPIYSAPALPRGGDFHGLVNLHGASAGQPRDLVLTDEDFGRAYLTEGWARTFLEQLFARYHVLFVGYTHTDPPVHYIARGLPSEVQPRRFAITHEDSRRWTRLGVGVIRLTLGAGGDFAPLTQGVTRWADVTRGSNFWLEDQIIQILARPDPSALTNEQANLLEWCLAHDRTVPFFTRNARGPMWVDWLGSRQRLARFFDPKTRLDQAHERQVAYWLADQLLAGPTERSFEIVRRHGGRFSRELHRWLLNRLGDRNLPIAWTFLVAQEIEATDQEAHYTVGQQLRTFARENLPAFWALFRASTEPRLGLDAHGFGGPGQPAYARVEINGQAAVLWSVWREAIVDRLKEFGRPMLGLLLVQLEHVTQLAHAVGGAEDFHRQVTGGRSRLARIDHDDHRESRPDVLIDMLVQVVTHLARRPAGLAEAEIRGWLDSSDGILRRLGLHALEESEAIDHPTKTSWARSRAESYPPESSEQREAAALVLRLAHPTPPGAAIEAPAQLPPVPETLPPLPELLAMDSRQLMRTVMLPRLSPTVVFAFLRQLSAATRREPRLSDHALWDLLIGRLSWRQLAPGERDELAALFQPPFALANHARAVVCCLFNNDPLEKDAREGQPPATPAQAAQLFALSQALWEILRDEQIEDTEDFAQTDWISLALNDDIGTYHLVRFWMQFVSLQPHDTAAPVLPADVAAIFADICGRASEVARRARAVLVQDMRFVMARDPGWTTTHVVPLFDFAAAGNEAWVAWRAFLDHGRISRPLALALLPHYRTGQARFLSAGEKLVGEFLQDVVTIVVHVRPASAGEWMQSLLPALPPEERLRWARLLGREIDGMPDDEQRDLWQVWLGQYWRDRRAGRLGAVNMPLLGGESALMAGWLPSLPEVFAEAFDLVRHSPDPDFTHEIFAWRELRKSPLPIRHPVEFLHMVEFLLAHMELGRVSHEIVVETAERLPRLAALRAPLLRIADVFQGHSWVPARDFRAWTEREFPHAAGPV